LADSTSRSLAGTSGVGKGASALTAMALRKIPTVKVMKAAGFMLARL
jgi:ABC-type dipeptide/oligopeptide/nickel transport system ATPase component